MGLLLHRVAPLFAFASVALIGMTACPGDAATPVTEVSCPAYCENIMATCTGIDAQFPDIATCNRFCVVYPLGELAKPDEDSIACRLTEVSNAKENTDAAKKHTDCVNAGISSSCGNDGQCVSYCKANIALCTGTNAAYPSAPDCETACKAWGQSFDGQLLNSVGDSLQCRTYHLELSQTGNTADLVTHCPHTRPISGKCFAAATDGGTDGSASTDAAKE
ncbi:hypothetical protein BH09MYX1_BH09MYX1_60960 [soil metagenome]